MEPAVPGLTVLDRDSVEALSAAARTLPRRRLNRNLHAMEDPVHRLLNAVEPGSYVRPHRHLSPPRTETAVAVAGRLGLLVFDGEGRVETRAVLAPAGRQLVAEIRPGTWHAFVALEAGTVFFEVKEGPYVAPTAGDVAAWAPAEGEPASADWERGWRELFRESDHRSPGRLQAPFTP